MLKNIVVLFVAMIMCTSSVLAKTDRLSAEYLKNKRHFAPLNPLVETVAQKVIKNSLKKSTGENFKVKFDGYTLYSMKQGVFKNLELEGDKFQISGIDVEYLKLKSITDYNKVNYKQNPAVIETDMTYAYELHLTESSINQALTYKDYKKNLDKINNITYPLFVLKDVDAKIKNNKLHIIMSYNFPISPSRKDKTFVVKTGLKVERNKISADDISFDSSYGALSADKVTNLINILDPLTFALDLMNTKKCNARIENVKIIDNIIQINGKIYVKGEGK